MLLTLPSRKMLSILPSRFPQSQQESWDFPVPVTSPRERPLYFEAVLKPNHAVILHPQIWGCRPDQGDDWESPAQAATMCWQDIASQFIISISL